MHLQAASAAMSPYFAKCFCLLTKSLKLGNLKTWVLIAICTIPAKVALFSIVAVAIHATEIPMLAIAGYPRSWLCNVHVNAAVHSSLSPIAMHHLFCRCNSPYKAIVLAVPFSVYNIVAIAVRSNLLRKTLANETWTCKLIFGSKLLKLRVKLV